MVGSMLPVGQHTLQAVMNDPTPMVRNDPTQVLRATRNWTVNVPPGAPRRSPFDFDVDGRSDASVFRPASENWFVLGSQNGFISTQFGITTDKIAPGDFDGDGKSDISVFRPSNGTWYRLNSSDSQFVGVQFGQNDDAAVPPFQLQQ